MDERNRIQAEIDRIEPTRGAKERMLANIKQKAEAQSQPIILAKEPKNAKILSFNRAMKWAIPIAACLVIALGCVFIAPHLLQSKSMAAPNDAALSGEPEASQKEASNSFEDQMDAPSQNFEPAKDSAPAEKADYSDYVGTITEQFTVDDHTYKLSSAPLNREEKYGHQDADPGEFVDENAAVKETDDGFEITWNDGARVYHLTSTDGATKDEILKVYESKK